MNQNNIEKNNINNIINTHEMQIVTKVYTNTTKWLNQSIIIIIIIMASTLIHILTNIQLITTRMKHISFPLTLF